MLRAVQSPVVVLLVMAVVGASAAVRAGAAESQPAIIVAGGHQAFFTAHCLKCHADKEPGGGVRLDTLRPTIDAVATAEAWQRVLNVLNSGEMPPPEEPRPEAAFKTEFLADLSQKLALARRTLGDQGRIGVLRRLNRREYVTTIRELMGIEPEVSGLPDDTGTGLFDTIGSSLFMSSDQFEQYLAIGRRVATAAVAEWQQTGAPPPRQMKRTEVEIAARRQVGGLLNGYFLGGYRKAKEWEAAGAVPEKAKDFGFPDHHEAKFRIRAYEQHGPYLGQYLALPKSDEGAWLMAPQANMHDTEPVTVPKDAQPGRYVLRLRIGAAEKVAARRKFLEMGIVKGGGGEATDFRTLDVFQIASPVNQPQLLEVPVTITVDGPRTFVFREKRYTDAGAANFEYQVARATNGVGPDPALWIDWVEWDGPVPDSGAADRFGRLFGSPSPPATADAAAVRPLLERFATRAFRGVKPDAGYLDRLVRLYDTQHAAGKPFAAAIIEPLAVVLASPGFLYLNEPLTVSAAGGVEDRSLSDLELASRLSYFLWAAPPDDELLAAAAAGDLRTPAGLERQARRLIADPRSLSLARGFTHQWLDVDRLDFFRFNPQLYPGFDESTREAAKEEIYHTFHLLTQQNLDVRQLLKSDFVVVNGLLAEYYGLQDTSKPGEPKPVKGDQFRRVTLPQGSPRGGLLGMAAVLGMGSNGERTSPVERGAWVLRKLLHDPPPPAPANVPQLSRLDGKEIDTRERLRMHQEEPQCAQCHRRIDPIGFGLENFDAAGLWRTEEVTYKAGVLIPGGPVGKLVSKRFPIEPAGSFHGGPAFRDFFELRDRVADRGDAFLRGLVEHLFAYGSGRPPSFADAEVIDEIVAAAKADGAGLGGIILKIVATPEFRTK